MLPMCLDTQRVRGHREDPGSSRRGGGGGEHTEEPESPAAEAAAAPPQHLVHREVPGGTGTVPSLARSLEASSRLGRHWFYGAGLAAWVHTLGVSVPVATKNTIRLLQKEV